MSRSAKVDSIEAIKDFRIKLMGFCEEATEALTSVELEIRRTMDWLQHQGGHWKKAIRDRENEVAQAKAELFRRELAGMSGEKPDCIEQKKALRRAQERLKEAHDKVKKCQEYGRVVERARDEYEGPARQLLREVEGKSPHAVVMLTRVIGSLDAYTATAPPPGGGSRHAPMPTSAPAPAQASETPGGEDSSAAAGAQPMAPS